MQTAFKAAFLSFFILVQSAITVVDCLTSTKKVLEMSYCISALRAQYTCHTYHHKTEDGKRRDMFSMMETWDLAFHPSILQQGTLLALFFSITWHNSWKVALMYRYLGVNFQRSGVNQTFLFFYRSSTIHQPGFNIAKQVPAISILFIARCNEDTFDATKWKVLRKR